MRQESIDLLEFQEKFCDEGACLDHLFKLRWPDGFTCPRCGGQCCSFVRTRRLYQCSACRYQTSVTAGTVFHKTRTPIRKWFWMIFMMARQKSGVSILRMQKLLKIGSYRTAWLMGHKIREALEDRNSDYKLAGLIEVDEALVGAVKSSDRRGRAAIESKIVVAVERHGTRARFRFLGRKEGSESRMSLCAAESNADNKGGLNRLRSVHAAIANIRGNIRGVHHGVSIKYLQRYLSEFCYRMNLRHWDSELFNRVIVDCVSTKGVTWADLTS